MLTNEELINAQKFFKGYLEEEIVKAKESIALNLMNYDITEEHLEQISKCTSSFKLLAVKVFPQLQMNFVSLYSLCIPFFITLASFPP